MKLCIHCHDTLPLDVMVVKTRHDGQTSYAPICKPCKNAQRRAQRIRLRTGGGFRARREDIKYDYRFARHRLGMSHERAEQWIVNGYGVHLLTMERWNLAQYASEPWEPDTQGEDNDLGDQTTPAPSMPTATVTQIGCGNRKRMEVQ